MNNDLRRLSIVLGLGVTLGASACGSLDRSGSGGGKDGDGAGGQGGGGSGGGAGQGQTDAGLDVSPGTEGGPTCSQVTTPLPYRPKTPDVILAFDRSDSMNQMFGASTRYVTVRDALTPLIKGSEGSIRWGYEEFPRKEALGCPTGQNCCADPVSIPPAFMNADTVNNAIATTGLSHSTPTPQALKFCSDFYGAFMDGIKERYVLLSTDGKPVCSLAGMKGEITPLCQEVVDQATMLLAQGVKTIVLGVSADLSEPVAADCLSRVALAGGAPRPGGPPHYYPATDPALLQRYLEEIIGGIAKPTCVVDLTSPPADPSKVMVFFDKVQVPFDPTHVDGWDWDAGSTTRIVIYGSWCAKLEGSMVTAIDVRFGCRPCGRTVACN